MSYIIKQIISSLCYYVYELIFKVFQHTNMSSIHAIKIKKLMSVTGATQLSYIGRWSMVSADPEHSTQPFWRSGSSESNAVLQ